MSRKNFALSLSLAMLFCMTSAFAQTYTYTTVNYTGDTFTQLLGVNNNNIIAGYHGFDPNQGFTYKESSNTFTTENYPNSEQTQVIGIDNMAAGTAGFFISDTGVTEGFTDSMGTFTAVNYPGSAFNQLLSQNDNWQAAGYYSMSTSGVPDVPYIYDERGGVFEVYTIPNATTAQATGINDSGNVCGFFIDTKNEMHGWLVINGTLTQLDAPKGKGTTAALGLNNNGQVVGSYVDSAGGTHGFVYSIAMKTWATIDDPNGVGETVVNGINNGGTLVGFYGPGVCNTNNCSGFIAKP